MHVNRASRVQFIYRGRWGLTRFNTYPAERDPASGFGRIIRKHCLRYSHQLPLAWNTPLCLTTLSEF